MKTYTVTFRSDWGYAIEQIKAKSPRHALKKAQRLAKGDGQLLLHPYDDDSPINEIEICDEHDRDQVMLWRDDELRLRRAASELLEAARLVLARWEAGDLAEAVRLLKAAVDLAEGGAS